MAANDALMQAERSLVSRSTSFHELWQQANMYSEGLDPASYAGMQSEYSVRREQ